MSVSASPRGPGHTRRRWFGGLAVVAAAFVTGCSAVSGQAVAISSADTPLTAPATEAEPSTTTAESTTSEAGAASGQDPASPSSDSPSTGPSPTSATSPSTSSTRTSAGAEPSPLPGDAQSPLAFGGRYTWRSGLSVTVAAPVRTQIDPADAIAGKKYVQITYTATNTGTAPISIFGGWAAPIIGRHDSAKGVRGVTDIDVTDLPLVPGQSFTWRRSYAIDERPTITVEFEPQDDRSVFFATDGTARVGKQPASDAGPRTTHAGGIVKFGQEFSFANGLRVKAFAPKPAPGPADAYARVPEGAKALVVLDVTITNGMTKSYDLGLIRDGLTVGGIPMRDVVATEFKVGKIPQPSLPPGKSVTVKRGFALTKDGPIVYAFGSPTRFMTAFTDIKVPRYVAKEPGAEPQPTTSSAAPSSAVATPTGPQVRVQGAKGFHEAKLGSVMVFDSGLKLSVSAPKRVTAERSSYTRKGAIPVVWTMTIINGSKETFSPDSVGYRVISGKEVAATLVKGYIDQPPDVPPGGSAAVELAGWVLDPADTQLELRLPAPYRELSIWFSSTGPVARAPAKPSDVTPGTTSVRVAFGKPWTFQDGSTVTATVTTADLGKAAGDKTTPVVVTVTVTNGGSAPQYTVRSSRALENGRAPESFDNPSLGISVDNKSEILPGRTLIARYGYVVKDLNAFSLRCFGPGIRDPAIIFTQSGK